MNKEKIKEYHRNDHQHRKETRHRIPLELQIPLYEKVKDQAEKESISVTELIKRIITEYLEK